MRKSIGKAKLLLWLTILPAELILPVSPAKGESDALIFEGDFESGVYFKTGIYKWVWNMTPEKDQSTTDKRVIFVDEVRIGSPNATYQDVAPGRDNAAKKETDRDDK